MAIAGFLLSFWILIFTCNAQLLSPTLGLIPTLLGTPPTPAPTLSVSLAPVEGITLAPLGTPTEPITNSPLFTPTEFPTQIPLAAGETLFPTNSPTNTPTNQPTHGPTNAPTNAPTNEPTNAPTYAPLSFCVGPWLPSSSGIYIHIFYIILAFEA